MATLVNNNSGAGVYKLSWVPKDLAVGCYTIRMQAGSNVYVKNIQIAR